MHVIIMHMLYTSYTIFLEAQFYLLVNFHSDYIVTLKVAEYEEVSWPSSKHNFSVVLDWGQ